MCSDENYPPGVTGGYRQGDSLRGMAGCSRKSIFVGRLISSLLFGVSAYDPATVLVVVLLVGLVATVASYIPARRTSRVDSMVVLAYE